MKFFIIILTSFITAYVSAANKSSSDNPEEGNSEYNKIILHWGNNDDNSTATKKSKYDKHDNYQKKEGKAKLKRENNNTDTGNIMEDPEVIEYNNKSPSKDYSSRASSRGATNISSSLSPDDRLTGKSSTSSFNNMPVPLSKNEISAQSSSSSSTAQTWLQNQARGNSASPYGLSKNGYNNAGAGNHLTAGAGQRYIYTILENDSAASVAKKFNSSSFEVRSLFKDSNQQSFVKGNRYIMPLTTTTSSAGMLSPETKNRYNLDNTSLNRIKEINNIPSSQNFTQIVFLPIIDRNKLMDLKVLPLPVKLKLNSHKDSINKDVALNHSAVNKPLSSKEADKTMAAQAQENAPKPADKNPTDKMDFSRPCKGKIISSTFKAGSKTQNGVIIQTVNGASITAVEDGIVALVNHSLENYAILIAINHGHGYLSVYGLTTDVIVEKGDSVKKGDIIAKARVKDKKTKNATMFFSLRYHKKPINPEDYIKMN